MLGCWPRSSTKRWRGSEVPPAPRGLFHGLNVRRSFVTRREYKSVADSVVTQRGDNMTDRSECPTEEEIRELESFFTLPSHVAKTIRKLVSYAKSAEDEIENLREWFDDAAGSALAAGWSSSPELRDRPWPIPDGWKPKSRGLTLEHVLKARRQLLTQPGSAMEPHHEPYTDLEQKIVDDPYDGVETALKEYATRKAAVPQVRQGYTDWGELGESAVSDAAALHRRLTPAGVSDPERSRIYARQRAQLLSFAARFAFELRKHGAFGMNREEGELLKEFDEWVEANGANER